MSRLLAAVSCWDFFFFLNLETQGVPSVLKWFMGVFSWIRDCCRQELDYLGQTRGISTEPSGNRPRAFSLRLQIEAVWAEAISPALLCMEGAPGLCCLPHLKIHQQHFTTLALWPPPAHSKKPLLSAIRKLCLSYHSQMGLTRRKPRPGRANAGLCCGVYNSNTGPLCQGRMLSSTLFEFLGAEFGRTQSREPRWGS